MFVFLSGPFFVFVLVLSLSWSCLCPGPVFVLVLSLSGSNLFPGPPLMDPYLESVFWIWTNFPAFSILKKLREVKDKMCYVSKFICSKYCLIKKTNTGHYCRNNHEEIEFFIVGKKSFWSDRNCPKMLLLPKIID